MNYAQIKENDIGNGPGVRLSLFVSGCTHHCKGCFNQMTWDFSYGAAFTGELQEWILGELGKEWYEGLTLLGGEPMEPVNQRGLLGLVCSFKERYPQKTIWCFTGYLLEDLLPGGKVHTEVTDQLLSSLDVLVDGPFVEAQKDITLVYKGSANQRTIDLPQTLASGQMVLWDPAGTVTSTHYYSRLMERYAAE